MTVSDIRDYLLREGYRAKLDEGDEATAEITSSTDGIPFYITFYREYPPDGDLEAFYSFSLTAGIEEDRDPNLLLLNQLNADNRFFKAYAERGVIWIEMDNLISSDELTEQMFENAFRLWTTFLHEMIRTAGDTSDSDAEPSATPQ
jgi:hypothetical protein